MNNKEGKYKYTYDKLTKEYQITRGGLSSAPFSNLRDCKLSWKFLKNMEWSINGKDWHNVKEESTNDKDSYKGL